MCTSRDYVTFPMSVRREAVLFPYAVALTMIVSIVCVYIYIYVCVLHHESNHESHHVSSNHCLSDIMQRVQAPMGQNLFRRLAWGLHDVHNKLIPNPHALKDVVLQHFIASLQLAKHLCSFGNTKRLSKKQAEPGKEAQLRRSKRSN